MWYRSFRREAVSVLFKAAVIVAAIILVLSFLGFYYEQGEYAISDGQCNVAVLPIEGVILPFASYSDYDLITTPTMVRDFIRRAEADPFIEAILLEINSPGGTPVAAEQISEIVSDTTLPTISLIGDMGTSGGYLVAAAADSIIASPMSDVGSIGVTMSYLEESLKNEEEGLTFVPLASGEFKDAGNPNKPLTDEERTLFEADLALVHEEFVKKVAEFRGLSIAEVEALADGSSMPGVRALEAGLVDQLGGRQVAKSVVSVTLGIESSQISFCEDKPVFLF